MRPVLSARDDCDARLAAYAEAMENAPSDAYREALFREINRQDVGAQESWLQRDRLDRLGSDGDDRISQAGFDALAAFLPHPVDDKNDLPLLGTPQTDHEQVYKVTVAARGEIVRFESGRTQAQRQQPRGIDRPARGHRTGRRDRGPGDRPAGWRGRAGPVPDARQSADRHSGRVRASNEIGNVIPNAVRDLLFACQDREGQQQIPHCVRDDSKGGGSN